MNHKQGMKEDKTGSDRNDSGASLWRFTTEQDGSFRAPYAAYVSRLYFPLMNAAGMKSYVTPDLKGDICLSFHQYLTAPLVTEEIHRNAAGRNFWIIPEDNAPWSVSGQSAGQIAEKWSADPEYHEVEAQPGMFNLKRKNSSLNLMAEVSIFVPANNDPVELMRLELTNERDQSITFKPAYAIPLYGRSADNFRDHRQVTSMFQQARMLKAGLAVKPTIVHDESGHQLNNTLYAVMAFDQEGRCSKDRWVLMKDFIGEGGSLLNPRALAEDLPAPEYSKDEISGREAIAAFRWDEVTLEAGEKASFTILHCIAETESEIEALYDKYRDSGKYDAIRDETRQYWQKFTSSIACHTADTNFDKLINWINYQVKCRQVFGNSYLPDFGYGRGGRGWRDLWQDLLAIFLIEPDAASTEILNNFKGIRIDGSNATIIGTEPGTFKADRNNIPRYWSDHGTWPVFALNFYIDQTDDLGILLRELPYWKDQFTHRTRQQDKTWNSNQGNLQLDRNGKLYQGSVFEHVLLQTLSSFYHVGEHNNLLLEGADWNDTYDMARDRGESVCFYHFYGFNLKILAELLESLKESGLEKVWLLEEIDMLLEPANMDPEILQSPVKKQKILSGYFEAVRSNISGQKKAFDIDELIHDLHEKSRYIREHIRENEWITTRDGQSFFNGHYDNHAKAVDGDHALGVRMDLPSQVMAVMCDTASSAQIEDILKSAAYYLRDKNKAGLRLCTDFKEVDMNIGRLTAFTYGFKEHGSKWMQQNVMLAYGLYRQGFAKEGSQVLQDVYRLATDSKNARIFPGLPSFFEPGDRGAYAYLTGSSTWFMLTLVSQVFGAKGNRGDLLLEPRLMGEQFDENGEASIELNFAGKRMLIRYINKEKLDAGDYCIESLSINDLNLREGMNDPHIILLREEIEKYCKKDINLIQLNLERKSEKKA